MKQPSPPRGGARTLAAWVANTSLLAAAAGLILALILIAVTGHNPVDAAAAAWRQTFGNIYRVATVAAWSLPLMIAGLGVAVAFRAGIYNLGGEGQIYLGAMAAALVGYQIGPLWPPLHVLLALAAAGCTGALIAWLLGLLRVRSGVDEVMSTLMSNYVVVLFTHYLASYPFKDPARWTGTTPSIHKTARLPTLLPSTDLTWGLLLVIAAVLGVYWLYRTRLGYEWRMVGLNPGFAHAAGIPVQRRQLSAMALSGFISGCAGGFLVLATQHRFWTEIGLGLGWDAILMTLIANHHPYAVAGWSLFYSVMLNGALGMEQATGVPSELSKVVIAAIILAIVARTGLQDLLRRALATRAWAAAGMRPARAQKGAKGSG